MAVVAVLETFDGTEGHEDVMQLVSYGRTFDVLVNSLQDTPDVILGAVDPITFLVLPQIGDLWLPNVNRPLIARCKDRKVDRNSQNPFQWKVKLEYGTDWQLSNPDPTLRPAKVRGEVVTYREAVASGQRWKFIGGILSPDPAQSPILNSALCPFDPPPERDVTRRRITITRYELNDPDPICEPYVDTVNAAMWRNYPPGCAKYCGCSYEGPEWFNGQYYYLVTHTVDCKKISSASNLSYRSEGWTLILLDAGYMKLDQVEAGDLDTGAPGVFKLNLIRDEASNPFANPQLLNGNGQPLPLPAPGTLPDAVYDAWRIYPMTDFTTILQLPNFP